MCGEQFTSNGEVNDGPGSPPRVRGTVSPGTGMSGSRGITPACAGNRASSALDTRRAKDHPRVCGEQFLNRKASFSQRGSPPRVRGTDPSPAAWNSPAGITPACAGNSFHQSHKRGAVQDHPRVCGEQPSPPPTRGGDLGSPPRVRGTDRSAWPRRCWPWITPACAGNRTHTCGRMTPAWDHPRVCGEQPRLFSTLIPSLGSPPRVRGTEGKRYCPLFGQRITPACAGNSFSSQGATAQAMDHPRVCGEQTKKSPSFLHSFLSDQENSFSLKYNCSISSQSFCARWTSLQGSSKCFAKVDS